jgi:Na+/H+ antiporter NhaD/arsenite permease-like protein
MMSLVATFTLFWLPRAHVQLTPGKIAPPHIAQRLGSWSTAALLLMVLALEYGHAIAGAGLLLAFYALLARPTLRRIDGWLLLTFAAIFLGLGHLADLPLVRHGLDQLDFSQPLTLYVSGIVASQLISNVPATVVLLDRTHDVIALAVAVNVGGFGVAIGSLANLIALRLARQPGGLKRLHLVSIPFLLLCTPLVYLAWRWLG